MKTTTFNVCAWILLASLALSVSVRAKTTGQRTEADDVNKINDEAEQQRMSKTGSMARNWEVARGFRDETPNSYAKLLDSRIGAHDTIKDINSQKDDSDLQMASLPSFSVLPVPNIADEIMVLNEEVKQRNIYEQRKLKGDFSLAAAVSMNTRFARGRKKKITEPEVDQIDVLVTRKFDGSEFTPSEMKEAAKSFSFINDTHVIVFSDGAACKHNLTNNKPTAGAGIWFSKDNSMNLGLQVPGPQTNNNAEVYAAIKAIERVKFAGYQKVFLQTDSFYLQKIVDDWMPTWASNGWKTTFKRKVKNYKSIVQLHKMMSTMSVFWNYTRFKDIKDDKKNGHLQAEHISRTEANCL